MRARLLGAKFSRPFMRLLSLRPDGSLATLKDGFVNRLQSFGSPTLCYSSYEAPDYYLGGLFPTEHTSLHWTCTGTFCFSSSNQFVTTMILEVLPDVDTSSPPAYGFIIRNFLVKGWMSQVDSKRLGREA